MIQKTFAANDISGRRMMFIKTATSTTSQIRAKINMVQKIDDPVSMVFNFIEDY